MNKDGKFTITAIWMAVIVILTTLYFRPTDNIYTISFYIVTGLVIALPIKMLGWIVNEKRVNDANYI